MFVDNNLQFTTALQADSRIALLLQTSMPILITHIACLAGVVPLMLDVLLDYFAVSMKEPIADFLVERSIFVVVLIIPSAVFVTFRSTYCIAALYVSIMQSRNVLIAATVHNSVSRELRSKSQLFLPRCYFLTVILYIFGGVLNTYGTFYGLEKRFLPAMVGIQSLSCFSYFVVLFRWIQLTRRHKLENNESKFTVDEFSCAALLIPFGIYGISTLLWNFSFHQVLWRDRNELTFSFYMVQHFLFTVGMTIVPGRTLRMLAAINTNSLNMKQQFVRFVSHEIRSPLNVVIAGLDILKSELDINSESKVTSQMVELVEDIFAASKSAVHILSDLLNYESIEAGNFILEKTWLPIAEVLKDKLNWAYILAENNNLTLSILDNISPIASIESEDNVVTRMDLGDSSRRSSQHCEDGDHHLALSRRDSAFEVEEKYRSTSSQFYVHADIYKIEQVIRNLITNAVKFTPSGGSVTIKIDCQLNNLSNLGASIEASDERAAVGVYRVEVTDTGAGISLEDQAKVFGQFAQFRKNELQKGGGSGLGLWIAKQIILKHKGHLGFSSAGRGFGSTFYFELPLYSQPLSEVTNIMEASHVSPLRAMMNSAIKSRGNFSFMLRDSKVADEHDLRMSIDSVSSLHSIAASVSKLMGLTVDTDSHSSTKGGGTKSQSFSLLEDQENKNSKATHRDLERGSPTRINRSLNSSDSTAEVFAPTTKVRPKARATSKSEDWLSQDPNLAMLPTLLENASYHSISPPVRILIVDDSAVNRKMLARLIESVRDGRLMHAHIQEADDGVTAVAALRHQMEVGKTFDVILMDNIMVNMSGPVAATIMRKDLQFTGIIIGVTGNALPAEISSFIDDGANQVLTKPLTKAILIDAIISFL